MKDRLFFIHKHEFVLHLLELHIIHLTSSFTEEGAGDTSDMYGIYIPLFDSQPKLLISGIDGFGVISLLCNGHGEYITLMLKMLVVSLLLLRSSS